MGVPTGGGLGTATGRIVINTSQLTQAQQHVRSASRDMQQALQQLGVAFSGQQLVRFAVEADRVATSYRRQSVAAVTLAGSQRQLNDLLQVYNTATGNAVDKAQALENVTKLMSVGFADSAEELNKFATAIRGISVAMGMTQDTVTQNLILELFTQRGARLDQLGLQYDKVKQRAEELRAADRGLTQQQAYQNAVLEQAISRFGGLTKAAEGQATGVEKLRKAWKDFQLEFGQGAGGGAVNTIAEGATSELEGFQRIIQDATEDLIRLRQEYEREVKPWPIAQAIEEFLKADPLGDFLRGAPNRFGPTFRDPVPSWMTSSNTPMGPSATGPTGFTPDQQTAITEWSREIADIERQANRERLDATRQYEQQRTDTIRRYEQTIARDAQDFAIARARAEEDYALGLQRFRRDIAQREARQLEDLERTIADARTDAAERGAERQAALDERLAEARSTSRERVAEMEEDFQRRRERAARDHQESLADAAGRLDAVAVSRQQRDYLKRQRDEQEDFNARLEKERKNETKRLAELEKANAKQVESEQKALDKRIRQANDAYQRQLEDARAADEQRLTDMSADFELRKTRENEDRALRLERLKEDHDAQLAEQARQHELHLIEIAERVAEETRLANEAFDKRMADLNIFHDGVKEREQAHYTRGLIAYQAYLDAKEAELARRTAQQGAAQMNQMITPGQFPSITTPSSVTNSSRSTSVIVNQQIIAAPGQSVYDVGAETRRQFELLLRELGQ